MKTLLLLPPAPELEEHAAFLLPLCDHLEGVQAAVAPVAVPTAERDERAVEAVVPGAVFIHVPQTVFVPTDCKTNAIQNVRRDDTTGKMIKKGKEKKEAERDRMKEAAGQTDSLFSNRIYSPSYDLSVTDALLSVL